MSTTTNCSLRSGGSSRPITSPPKVITAASSAWVLALLMFSVGSIVGTGYLRHPRGGDPEGRAGGDPLLRAGRHHLRLLGLGVRRTGGSIPVSGLVVLLHLRDARRTSGVDRRLDADVGYGVSVAAVAVGWGNTSMSSYRRSHPHPPEFANRQVRVAASSTSRRWWSWCCACSAAAGSQRVRDRQHHHGVPEDRHPAVLLRHRLHRFQRPQLLALPAAGHCRSHGCGRSGVLLPTSGSTPPPPPVRRRRTPSRLAAPSSAR